MLVPLEITKLGHNPLNPFKFIPTCCSVRTMLKILRRIGFMWMWTLDFVEIL
jgi:hypothetical protein